MVFRYAILTLMLVLLPACQRGEKVETQAATQDMCDDICSGYSGDQYNDCVRKSHCK